MENISLPIEAMDEIFKMRFAEIMELDKRGAANTDDYLEIYKDGFIITATKFEKLSENYQYTADLCLKYGETIIRMQKELQRERRIVQLFLQNHGLYMEYENFEARILERIFLGERVS